MPKSIQQRKAELQEQLAKLEEQEKREETTRHALIGAVVDKAMKGNVELGQIINDLLETTLTKKADREKFGLAPLPTKKGRPSST